MGDDGGPSLRAPPTPLKKRGTNPPTAQTPPKTARTHQAMAALTTLAGGAEGSICHQARSLSDRPTTNPISLDPSIQDPFVEFQVAFKSRPIRDGGGKPSPGRLAPWARPNTPLGRIGRQILLMSTPWTDRMTWSIDCGDKIHPFSADFLQDIRHTLDPGQQHTQAPGQPFFLTIARQGGDPEWQYPLTLQQGVPLGVTTPTLTSPNVWPLKSELAGEDREPSDLPDPTGRANYPSANDFVSEIPKTFEEEVPMGMVSGPLTKSEAAALCKCAPTELCPGPLAGIDEGDKIRTIYDGSIGGANTHIQNHTQERTTAPTVLDCVQVHAKDHPEKDPLPSTGASSPELGEGPSEDWLWPPRNCGLENGSHKVRKIID